MGVKQLWTLLSPVGRPVLLETMEGKTVAIDSSIWIYQFQATMRDKDGRALVNAHVLGFLRRICKLLFYGIKPVFVFDGGAPVLKKHTIAERKRKKAGAADSHSKIAQKLLAAQMRREALLHVQKSNQKPDQTSTVTEENTVYLEDLVANPATAKPSTAAKPESAKKKNKFHDYDPYRLPEVDLSSLSRPTTSLIPDPRLATEEELRQFIEEMRPEDFDVSSPAFRELPTEIQYEIIGDLRLRSRQTSYKRLQAMLRSSNTPLDFSEAQIKNLKQRNALTQQLLETTDSIGRANVVIPVRIASERNKEYVLVKNQGAEGGWILGANNEGSKDKPIEIDEPVQKVQQDEDSDGDMEEVDTTSANLHTDLQVHYGRMALAAAPSRHSQHSARSKGKQKAPDFAPLSLDDEDLGDVDIQEVLLQQAQASAIATRATANDLIPSHAVTDIPNDDDDDDLYVSGLSRLDTALAFANTPSRRDHSHHTHSTSTFGTPVLLLDPESPTPTLTKEQSPHELMTVEYGDMQQTVESIEDDDDDDLYMEEVPSTSLSRQPVEETVPHLETTKEAITSVISSSEISPAASTVPEVQNDFSFEESIAQDPTNNSRDVRFQSEASPSPSMTPRVEENHLDMGFGQSDLLSSTHAAEIEGENPTMTEDALNGDSISRNNGIADVVDFMSDRESSSSPVPTTSKLQENVPPVEAFDAAEEMDIVAEEGDFAELVSQMKNQDLQTAQREIDEEIKQLNKQRKAAIRDSEDVTQHMISQIMIMLRLFGLPYITAPMEAEAQCAALVSLGLVEGVITDDSDVFLFGGLRVYKNMFNQSKTVECFLLNDLSRELGLDRDTLIRLAYLLGSDYVEGLPGVGPVVAMELLKEFPGEDGLHKFKAWWQKVQSGKDTDSDTNTKFKERFKKRFKKLYLSEEWPNPAVRDAYSHPTIDESEEPFKWGLPDLDALHQFFHDELSWSQNKVDELLVPIIRKIGQRNQAVGTNRQGTLNNYFDVSFGSGTYAPRRRQAYSSKRLQQIVKDFRANQQSSESTSAADSEDQVDPPVPSVKRKRQAKKTTKAGKRRKKDDITTPPEVDTDADKGGDTNVDEESLQVSAVRTKLRVKPKPRYKEVHSDEVGDDSDSDDIFMAKRDRKT